MTVDVMAEARDPSVWLLIGLVAVTLISFWIQAIITEERFVPALNVISNHYRIPSDIAGATLMAAGASSPVLLSSFMTLFVSHSSLGLGTILGSEIFNQLIIVSGAIFASPTVGLRLDPAIVIREVGFYALSILLLYMALRDTRPDNNGVYYIYINFGVSCYVLAGYIVYVLVCANMDAIAAVFGSFQQHDNEKCHDLRSNEYGGGDGCDARQVLPSRSATLSMESTASPTRRGVSFDHIDCPDRKRKMPFLCEKSLMTREPSSNFETVEFSKSHPGGEMLHNVGDLLVIVGSSACGLGVDGGECIMHETKPSREHGLYDMEVSENEDLLSCFLWQRSHFYDNARFTTRAWHLRWFTFTPDSMHSFPDHANAERHCLTYPDFGQIEVDEDRLILRLVDQIDELHSLYLLAPSKEILNSCIAKMERIMERRAALPPLPTEATDPERDLMSEFSVGAEESLVEYPTGSTTLAKVVFVALFPFRILIHWTVPDVRVSDSHNIPMGKLSTAFLAVVSCLCWLIVGSYTMVLSLEALAKLLHTSQSFVGISIAAAGTSVPNYIASRIAAERGFGNMAVSHAFGSNTFNIMIGLGLPWVIYTSFATDFQPYNDLRDEGLTESVTILGSALLVFLAIIISSGFVLYRWHGILFIALYVVFIAYEIAKLYL